MQFLHNSSLDSETVEAKYTVWFSFTLDQNTNAVLLCVFKDKNNCNTKNRNWSKSREKSVPDMGQKPMIPRTLDRSSTNWTSVTERG